MKCAPRIWKKFTLLQKIVWQVIYNVVVEDYLYPPGWSDKESKKKREVLAHNVACWVAWEID